MRLGHWLCAAMVSNGLTSLPFGSWSKRGKMRQRRSAWIVSVNTTALGAQHSASLLSPSSSVGPWMSLRPLAITGYYYKALSQALLKLTFSHWNLNISVYWLCWAQHVPAQRFSQQHWCSASSHCIAQSTPCLLLSPEPWFPQGRLPGPVLHCPASAHALEWVCMRQVIAGW